MVHDAVQLRQIPETRSAEYEKVDSPADQKRKDIILRDAQRQFANVLAYLRSQIRCSDNSDQGVYSQIVSSASVGRAQPHLTRFLCAARPMHTLSRATQRRRSTTYET